jgi:hypothetical protein
MTKAEALKKGCLVNAANDEPVFILRAQDRCAPGAVRDWAHRAANLGANGDKVSDAMDVALEMERWQTSHTMKVPD